MPAAELRRGRWRKGEKAEGRRRKAKRGREGGGEANTGQRRQNDKGGGSEHSQASASRGEGGEGEEEVCKVPAVRAAALPCGHVMACHLVLLVFLAQG